MRVALFTREYPPHIYGGAGVHVEYLSRELAKKIDVDVHCWGDQHYDQGMLHVRGAQPWSEITDGAEGKFKAALLGRAEGLSEEEKNIFLNNWDALKEYFALKMSQGIQARGA